MFLKNKNISIVGGGLVGSLLSVFLKKQGADVTVFDKRNDIRSSLYTGSRSINLALSNRGIQALEKMGISDSILKIAMPMYKRIMHDLNGNLTHQLYGQENQAILSISRKMLNAQLINVAEENGVNFDFGQECIAVDFNRTKLSFSNSSSFKSDFIFGSDGAGSVVRKLMKNSYPDLDAVESFIGYGYKELTIHANNGVHKLANNALHIWPRKSHMVIALPNLDGTFTCTLFAPLKGSNCAFDSLITNDDVNKFFTNYYCDLIDIVPDLVDQYFTNPLSSLGFVRCSSWKKKNVFLIGDACHATVPFYGQGMNSGFEDCYLLNEWLDKYHDLNHDNINQFLNQRIIDTTAMQDLSMMNHIEMRDKTSDPAFLLQKKIEKWFSDKYPSKWIPLYSMVTFSHMGYEDAMRKGRIQHDIMHDIMKANKLCYDFNVNELLEKRIAEQILEKLNNLKP